MKYLLVLVSLALLASAFAKQIPIKITVEGGTTGQSRSVSSVIADKIEDVKSTMPCGFPEYGLGPLAPAYVSHQEFEYVGESFEAAGEVNDFYMHDLDNFDIVEMNVNLITSRVTFNFLWKDFHLSTDYKALVNSKSGFIVKRECSGPAEFGMKNFRVFGTARYSIGLLSGVLSLRQFNLKMSVDEVYSKIEGLSNIKLMNKLINEVIAETVYLAINDNTENFQILSNKYVVPLVNNIIGERGWRDLIGGGSGSGTGEPKPPKEPCVKPAFKELFL